MTEWMRAYKRCDGEGSPLHLAKCGECGLVRAVPFKGYEVLKCPYCVKVTAERRFETLGVELQAAARATAEAQRALTSGGAGGGARHNHPSLCIWTRGAEHC